MRVCLINDSGKEGSACTYYLKEEDLSLLTSERDFKMQILRS